MKKKQQIISYLSFILFFSIIKINFDSYILEPTSYYDDYFNKTHPKQYETLPNMDLNNNNNNNNKIDDFHYYFDDYDYYNNYKDFKYYDKKDDYYDHHYYDSGYYHKNE